MALLPPAADRYYQLAKPRLTYGNVFTAVCSYLYATRWHISWSAFLALIIGLAFVIGSACVVNNVLDRDMDAKMARTQKRATVTGTIPPKRALAFAAILGAIGFTALLLGTNAFAALAALAGFLIYVLPYTASKRATSAAAIIGSAAGAAPIVIGYVAATHAFDTTALILFLILAIWQLPHFYAIATYRAEDYAAAGIPTMPAVRGARWTRWSITLYIAAFTIAVAILPRISMVHLGYVYFVAALVPALFWLQRAVRGFIIPRSGGDTNTWARGVFRASLIALMSFSFALALGPLLP